jgi:hypothetical protein
MKRGDKRGKALRRVGRWVVQWQEGVCRVSSGGGSLRKIMQINGTLGGKIWECGHILWREILARGLRIIWRNGIEKGAGGRGIFRVW